MGDPGAAGHRGRVPSAGSRDVDRHRDVDLLLLAWGPVSAPDNWWSLLLIVILVIAGVEALRRSSLAREQTELEAAEAAALEAAALEAGDATLPS